MQEYAIKKSKDVKMIIHTLSKKNIMDAFYHVKSIYRLQENELLLENEHYVLPIDLKKWQDLDSQEDFTNVLKVLERITRPKGFPLDTVKATLSGYDLKKQQAFTFKDDYVSGIHSLVGEYEDGTKLLYQEKLYLNQK
ncbi:hypothetical protein [Thomasclavelia sp.]|uniref:hypothetical protein n=1 Tax=Thomasclavelia sp. TaxID=3025757 RepID=UPI0025DCC2E1|nr:hypothetical protein [Thomasclavelia sp.]